MMDKEETSLQGNHGDSMRKSFCGVIDETEEEIMNSFASLVLKSDELLRMTMDGSSLGKLGDAFDDDISTCYDDDEDDSDNDNEHTAFLLASKIEKFDSQILPKPSVHGSPKHASTSQNKPVMFRTPSGMSSPPPSNAPIPVQCTSALTPKKETKAAAPIDDKNIKPKRPLSAYNLYFQLERERLIAGVDPDEPFSAEDVKRIAIQRRELEQNPGRPKRKHRKSHGKISFAELARNIADKWKNLKPEAKDLLQERAAIEKTRYLRELEEWTKYNNTSSDGIYSPKATSIGQPAQCPKTPIPTPNYMPSHFISPPPRRIDHTGGPIFHRNSYPGSPPPRMHHDSVSVFRGPPHSPPPHHLMLPPYQQQQQQHYQYLHEQLPHGRLTPPCRQQQQQQQHQQQHQRYHHKYHSEERYPYEQLHRHQPAFVSPSASFDSSFEPQDLKSEASALAERFGWSTSSVLDMMRELDQKRQRQQRSSPISCADDDDDSLPSGILDEVRFTPI